jgi:biotin-dependent enzyme
MFFERSCVVSNVSCLDERKAVMQYLDIRVDESLWGSSMLPEGTVERWFVANGAVAAAGAPMAEVRIEDALHEITAPANGRLTIFAAANSVIEPGSLLAKLDME